MFSTTEWLLLIWLALLGGCIGSFLNVVIYRLPRGESLVHPGSRCPHCDHAIRAYHNIPVFGWLMLRGRCHDCGQHIAARYPLVEATVAGIFVAVAYVVFLWGGNDAVQPWTDPLRWGIFASLVCSLATLLCVALIRYDEARVPTILYVILIASALAAGMLRSVAVYDTSLSHLPSLTKKPITANSKTNTSSLPPIADSVCRRPLIHSTEALHAAVPFVPSK